MRITLTIDDDLAGLIQNKASQQGCSFKAVVNDLLRAGLAAQGGIPSRRKPIKIITKPMGLKTGYDPGKLNQLVDELEVEDFLNKQSAHQS